MCCAHRGLPRSPGHPAGRHLETLDRRSLYALCQTFPFVVGQHHADTRLRRSQLLDLNISKHHHGSITVNGSKARLLTWWVPTLCPDDVIQQPL